MVSQLDTVHAAKHSDKTAYHPAWPCVRAPWSMQILRLEEGDFIFSHNEMLEIYSILYMYMYVCANEKYSNPQTNMATSIKNITHTVFVKKNATQIIICAPLFDKKRTTLLRFTSGFVREVYCDTFCQTCCNFCQNATFQRNAPHFHGKIQGLRRFTRRRTFKNSVKVWHTQRNKRRVLYATLISAAATRLLHSFWHIP